MRTLFKNCNIIDFTGERTGSVLIEDKKISKIFLKGEIPEGDFKVIEAEGLTLMPSFIDTHSHLRDPGLTYKEDIQTGLKAAAKGGFTTVCAMANTLPVTDSVEKVNENLKKAQALGLTDLIQVASVTKDFGNELVDFESLSEYTPIFSNDGHNIDDPEIIREALKASKNGNFFIATHNEPETETIVRDIDILRETDGKLHICHLSKEDSLKAVKEAKKEELLITCEVTPHHLFKSDISFKVHPPFRHESDRLALIEGIKEGIVDTIGTDHAPHSVEDKEKGSPGLIGYETAFGIVNKVFKDNDIPLSTLSKLMSYNPAKLLNISGGIIKEGETANLVLVDPDKSYILEEKDIISKSHNTPFYGETLKGKILLTMKDGEIIYSSDSQSAFDKLALEAENSVVCLGLDTRLDYLPKVVRDRDDLTDGQKIALFNKAIIDATKDLVACYKVQIACYEALGLEGLKAYSDTLKAIKDAGKISIGDVKRGDIFSTAEEYAHGHFTGDFEADIITLNPYMGEDAIAPYYPYLRNGKGLFILTHTSNPSSQDFEEQELSLGGVLFETVADKVDDWGKDFIGDSGYSGIGAVVGLTYPEALIELSEAHPQMFFLVPGYGAQGGTAEDIAKILKNKRCAVVNNSRKILTAHQGKTEGEDYIDYIVAETKKMKEDIENALCTLE